MTESLREVPGWDGLDVTLTPIASQSFLDAIKEFERVRIASLRVARPNMDWTDNFNHLAEVAADSDGGAIEVTITANRGGSISKRKGLIQYMRDMMTTDHPSILGARVTGSREGEDAETTISLANHVEHQRVKVLTDETGRVLEDQIRDKLLEFANLRRQQRRKRQ